MLKILIVDDSLGWRNFNKEALENIFGEKNVDITLADSAKDGYDKLLYAEKSPFDLIMTDLQMESDFAPMIAGEWFVRQVKNFQKYKNAKIIIVSAMYNIEMTAELLNVDFICRKNFFSVFVDCRINGS